MLFTFSLAQSQQARQGNRQGNARGAGVRDRRGAAKSIIKDSHARRIGRETGIQCEYRSRRRQRKRVAEVHFNDRRFIQQLASASSRSRGKKYSE